MKKLNFTKIMAVCLALFMLAGCQEENNVEPRQDVSLKDMMATLETFDKTLTYNIYKAEGDLKGDFTSRRWRQKLTRWATESKTPTFYTLMIALKDARINWFVENNEVTVLAPTDDAFFALGITPENVDMIPNLREILLYHVLEGTITSSDLSDGYATTLNEASVKVSLEDGVFFNQAEVISADNFTDNGVIHVIDQVIFPPTLLDIVDGNENFSILKTAIETAGLESALEDPDAALTVFAPTDAAFLSVLEELELTPADLLGSPDLSTILLYHVFGGEVFSTDLADGLTVDMLAGGSIEFDLESMPPSIIDGQGRVVPLNTGLLDIRATNGVVHVVDRVLLP